MAHEDWMPTLLAAAGDPDVKEELLQGKKVGKKKFNVHLDGYNFQPFFKGEVDKGPRREFFYFNDHGDLHALRYDDWKISFKTMKGNLLNGTVVETNAPLVVNLRQDPFERFPDEAAGHMLWWGEKLWTLIPAVTITGQFLETFTEYPPSQATRSTGVSEFLQAIQASAAGSY
jgi:arylsulfatase